MATQALAQPRYLGNRNQDVPRRYVGGLEDSQSQEAASQTFGAGALTFLSSGKHTIATATSQLAAQALAAATGTTSANFFGARIRPGDRFVMNVYHSTAASAVTVITQLGVVYPLVVVGGQFHCDIENVSTAEDATHSNGRVKVVGFYSEDAIGDIYGRVVVEFEEWSMASDGNPNQRILQLA